ncbi:MAG: hypothetical protein ACLPWF_05080 [Bryobacteraceae bacterium]
MSKKHTETPAGKTPQYPEIPAQPKSIIQPIIDELTQNPTTNFPAEDEVAPPNCGDPEPAELDQDPGGGYNPDGTYPQT